MVKECKGVAKLLNRAFAFALLNPEGVGDDSSSEGLIVSFLQDPIVIAIPANNMMKDFFKCCILFYIYCKGILTGKTLQFQFQKYYTFKLKKLIKKRAKSPF
jgi:hypothetical protein